MTVYNKINTTTKILSHRQAEISTLYSHTSLKYKSVHCHIFLPVKFREGISKIYDYQGT